jgi:hypothetical protein
MIVDPPLAVDEEHEPRRSRRIPVPRLALIVFVLTEAIAFPLLLNAGRQRWFFGDDWFFLVATSSRTLFKTNTYGHWLTLPILTYHLFWWLFGLRHFTAYLLLIVVMHLITAALVRAVMRRCGADPWVSTLAAAVLVFFGAGAADILQPAQITFVGSLVFGLSHLLLADHDGHVDYRDFLGLACGLAGLMCSNVSIALVATVGIAVLVRRGWRVALLHTVPLGLIYIAWWFRYARTAHDLLGKRASLGRNVRFIWRGLRTTFVNLGHFSSVGLLLAAMLVVGLVVAWRQATAEERRRSAPAGALMAGAVLFIGSAGLLRASPAITPVSDAGYVSRYAYVSAAMLLPAVAVATTALIRRWRFVTPVVVVILLIGVPGNYHALTAFGENFPAGYQRDFLVLAHSPLAATLKPSTRVSAAGSPGYMNAGWLASGAKSGRIPQPRDVTPVEAATAALNLSLSPYSVSGRHGACRPVATDTVVVQTGEQIFATGRLHIEYVTDSGAVSRPAQMLRLQRFQAQTGPLTLRILRYPGEKVSVLEHCSRPFS